MKPVHIGLRSHIVNVNWGGEPPLLTIELAYAISAAHGDKYPKVTTPFDRLPENIFPETSIVRAIDNPPDGAIIPTVPADEPTKDMLKYLKWWIYPRERFGVEGEVGWFGVLQINLNKIVDELPKGVDDQPVKEFDINIWTPATPPASGDTSWWEVRATTVADYRPFGRGPYYDVFTVTSEDAYPNIIAAMLEKYRSYYSPLFGPPPTYRVNLNPDTPVITPTGVSGVYPGLRGSLKYSINAIITPAKAEYPHNQEYIDVVSNSLVNVQPAILHRFVINRANRTVYKR